MNRDRNFLLNFVQFAVESALEIKIFEIKQKTDLKLFGVEIEIFEIEIEIFKTIETVCCVSDLDHVTI